MQDRLHGYLATVARNNECECYRVGGVEDHVHLAIRLSRSLTISDFVRVLKQTSSKWMKNQGVADFQWQLGYGSFSVSPSHLNVLLDYIENQEEHHKKETFQDEYRRILDKYNIEYDERYVWD